MLPAPNKRRPEEKKIERMFYYSREEIKRYFLIFLHNNRDNLA